jgi:CelD/BcsL family acetyltransferase involved in cellulose biosynthesis
VARDQRLWLLKIGYDPAYARCRPGHLLLLQTLARAARQGLRSCEFMGHAAPWTAQWTTTMRDCVGLRVYPMTRPGLRAYGEDVAHGLIRRLHQAAIRMRAGAAGASRLHGPKAAVAPTTPPATAAAASATPAGTASPDAKDPP